MISREVFFIRAFSPGLRRLTGIIYHAYIEKSMKFFNFSIVAATFAGYIRH